MAFCRGLRRQWRAAVRMVEALVHLAAARVVVAVFPFSWTTRLIGRPGPGRTRNRSTEESDEQCVHRVRRTVASAARAPFPWAVCLPQTLAAHWMLNRRGVRTKVCFGARRGPAGLSSHAWLAWGDGSALPGEEQSEFPLVAEFPVKGETDGCR